MINSLSYLLNIRIFLNLIPVNFRAGFFYRFFFRKAEKRDYLFKSATLEFNKSINMNLSKSDKCHQLIAYTGFFELHLTRKFVEIASQGGHFIDVGANYGYYSLLWAGARNGNSVLAIEAVPTNAKKLEENVALNEFGKWISVLALALGKKKEQMFFDLVEESQTTWGGLSISKATGYEVEVVTLDSVCDPQKTINLLKIDVEGAEFWVLQGAVNLLKMRKIKNIFFEENLERQEKLMINPGAAKRLLEGYGYTVVQLNENSSPVSEYHAFLKL